MTKNNIKNSKKRFKTIIAIVVFCIVIFGLYMAYFWNLIPGKSYTADDFKIKTLVSDCDYDGDGIDDYRDIMEGARKHIKTKPKYDGSYHEGGYPPEGVGVCTDVIWKGFKNAGYSFKDLVDTDISENLEAYTTIDTPDPNIDFRRVKNLKIFFARNAESLTLDPNEIEQWQPGDIVIYSKHIAIVSDKRNSKGQAYIIHHGGQPILEEDALTRQNIVGHYRWTK